MCEQVAPTNREDVVYKVYKYFRIFDMAFSKKEDALKIEDENGKHKDQVQEVYIILREDEKLESFPLNDVVNRYDSDFEQIIETYTTEYVRICSHCTEVFDEGYLIDDGSAYYCSEKCLDRNISEKEYLEMYENDVAFWTTFWN